MSVSASRLNKQHNPFGGADRRRFDQEAFDYTTSTGSSSSGSEDSEDDSSSYEEGAGGSRIRIRRNSHSRNLGGDHRHLGEDTSTMSSHGPINGIRLSREYPFLPFTLFSRSLLSVHLVCAWERVSSAVAVESALGPSRRASWASSPLPSLRRGLFSETCPTVHVSIRSRLCPVWSCSPQPRYLSFPSVRT